MSPKVCQDTFNTWIKHEAGEVVEGIVEKDYRSTYQKAYDLLVESGWNFKDGHWVAPDGEWKHADIYKAAGVCKMRKELCK